MSIVNEIRESAMQRTVDVSKPERVGALSPGDVVRQGDLYLIKLEDDYRGEIKDAQTERQLAPGTTQGARHILEGDVTIWKTFPQSLSGIPVELQGPSFHCNGECSVTHPEHGNKILPAGSSWTTTYQRVHAEEVRRTQD